MKLAAIHESFDKYMPSGKCSFQFGDCGVEVLRAVRRALDANFNRFRVVEGMVSLNGSIIPHTWIEVGGEVRDPTASQFADADVVYAPEGEYREEYSPEEYMDTFQEQYGVSPSEV